MTAAFVLFLTFSLAPTQMKAAESVAWKRIAIVLDNSDSMIISEPNVPYLTRWVEATYALRTLLHMIGDQDEVALYTVSDGKALGGKAIRKTSQETTLIRISRLCVFPQCRKPTA